MTSTRSTKGRPAANPRAASSGSVNARRAKIAAIKPPNRRPWLVATVIAIVILVLAGLYVAYRGSSSSSAGSATNYQVGTPGVEAAAPGFTLTSTTGHPVALSSFHGKTVLLYFHEGLGCQPCWDQIRDLDAAGAKLRAAGIDQLLTITSGPVDLIGQKMADDKLTATALADTDLSVSRTYNANQFGMMGTDRDGHSFILVGPDGRIAWRADYGGAPRYTMFVPVDQLLADLKAGRRPA
jgi:peroxiredoxin Q/BCP